MENGNPGSGVSHSPKEIKALTDLIAKRVRDEVTAAFQVQLEEMRQEARKLQETIEVLTEKVPQLEDLVADTEMVVDTLRQKVTESQNKYNICKREVFVLRTAIQDSYRAIEENALQQQLDRESKWRRKGTQIACSVCAIRYEQEEHGHEGALTLHVEETDRIVYPRATRHFHRVHRTQEIENQKKEKKTFAFAYAPHRGADYEEPPTSVSRHRNTAQNSPQKDKSNHKKNRKKSVETNIGELAVGHTPPNPTAVANSSKFSQMKNIPSSSSFASSKGGNGTGVAASTSTAAKITVPISQIHVSKVAALLQNDSKVANFKKLQNTNDLLNMTTAETVHMFKLLGSASKNGLDNKTLSLGINKKSQRPISAPPTSHNVKR